MYNERRDQYRVVTGLPAAFRTVSAEQFERLGEEYQLVRSGMRDIKSVLLPGEAPIGEAEKLDHSILAVLCDISRKLDGILDLLTMQAQDQCCRVSEPAALERVVVEECSGGGLRFATSTKMESGALIDLLLVLPATAPVGVRFLGRVIRQKDRGTFSGSGTRYVTSVEIAVIHDEDRIELEQFIHRRQQQILANRNR